MIDPKPRHEMNSGERDLLEADKLIGWRHVAATYERLLNEGIDCAENQMLLDAAVVAIREYQRAIWRAESEADLANEVTFAARFPTWRDS